MRFRSRQVTSCVLLTTPQPSYKNKQIGDPYAGWDPDSGMPAQVKAQLTLGLSGLPFSGSDIGGFVWEEPPSEVRYCTDGWGVAVDRIDVVVSITRGIPALPCPLSH